MQAVKPYTRDALFSGFRNALRVTQILTRSYTFALAQSVHLKKVTLNDCEQEEDICSLDRNETMRLKIKFHTKRKVMGGTPKSCVTKRSGRKVCSDLTDSRANICNSIAPSCPLAKNKTYTYRLIDKATSFKYNGNLQFKLKDMQNKTFLCLKIAVDVN
ncbi:hypothetical protein PHET_09433 [Paragonimus heterotremus]|uniref:MD-2-related lipid-recognition domain-containing protein n=1 Tax=Paragonimus heterotremus TaxID=100268 RepID=A0A8J4WD23_9TREM|nr:hypothetical protein PHET_09433 [Paragonimus heterotremus]